MRPIQLRLKSDQKESKSEEPQPIDESLFNETIRNLRILLNKLTKENYTRIVDTIINCFQYDAKVFQELAVFSYFRSSNIDYIIQQNYK